MFNSVPQKVSVVENGTGESVFWWGLPRPLPAPIFSWAAGDVQQHLQIKHGGSASGSMAGEREPEST